MIDVADRIGVVLGPETFDLIKGQFRSGGDDQIIVIHRRAVTQLDAVFIRVNALGARRAKADAVPRQHRRQVDNDVVLCAPFHGNPWIRWGELEEWLVGNRG